MLVADPSAGGATSNGGLRRLESRLHELSDAEELELDLDYSSRPASSTRPESQRSHDTLRHVSSLLFICKSRCFRKKLCILNLLKISHEIIITIVALWNVEWVVGVQLLKNIFFEHFIWPYKVFDYEFSTKIPSTQKKHLALLIS